MYIDIPGYNINGGTIQADIITTLERPDIVILNRSEKIITLFELTVSFEKNADAANIRKNTKYVDLCSDIRNNGWNVECIPFEIGSRGHINNRNKITIAETLKKNRILIQKKQLYQDICKISLLCSFSIFQAHCQPVWQSPHTSTHDPVCTAALWEPTDFQKGLFGAIARQYYLLCIFKLKIQS